MPRKARIDALGALHHIICREIKRMGELAAETQTAIYAWAFLTNHAHILRRR